MRPKEGCRAMYGIVLGLAVEVEDTKSSHPNTWITSSISMNHPLSAFRCLASSAAFYIGALWGRS